MATKVVQTSSTKPSTTGGMSGGYNGMQSQPKAEPVRDTTTVRPTSQNAIDRMLVQVYGSLDAVPENDPLKDSYLDTIYRRDWKAMYPIRDQIKGNLAQAEKNRQVAAELAAAAAARRAKFLGANQKTVADAFGFFNDDYFNNLYNQQANRQMGGIDSAGRRMQRMIRDSGYYGSPLGDQMMNELASLRSSGMAEIDRARDGYISGERSRVDSTRSRLSSVDDAEVASAEAMKQADALRNNPTDLRVDNPFSEATRQRWASTLFNGRPQQ